MKIDYFLLFISLISLGFAMFSLFLCIKFNEDKNTFWLNGILIGCSISGLICSFEKEKK